LDRYSNDGYRVQEIELVKVFEVLVGSVNDRIFRLLVEPADNHLAEQLLDIAASPAVEKVGHGIDDFENTPQSGAL
jgi:hypothetical protein